MYLILDFGNTRKKAAIFNGEMLIEEIVFDQVSEDVLKDVLSRFPEVSAGILSSVVNYPSSIDQFLENNMFFIKLDHRTELPISMQYNTPETLGIDRIALAVAANHMFSSNHILVIDAGTCITYDLITDSGVFMGGAISPGLETRFKALNTFTDRLPLVSQKEVNYTIGKNTQECILSGVINGTLYEIDAFIEQIMLEYKGCKVIITGGHANYFDKKLKNNIFAVQNLVMIGLNLILKFNFEK
ncbi:MAG: type III pantothenate kinase [Bacteroidales bacterium]|nr:type III pantothenate kinase [Bacteroidales bacterium]